MYVQEQKPAVNSLLTIASSNNSGKALFCQELCYTIAYAFVGCTSVTACLCPLTPGRGVN